MLKMVIEIRDFGAKAVASLYYDHAPKTIAALQEVLPYAGPGL